MTGEGIFYAVLSGGCAGAVAVAGPARALDPGAAYRSALRHRLGRHLRHTTLAARLARTPGLVEAALDAAARDRGTFDVLVELGLGAGLLTPGALRGTARALLGSG